MKTFLLFPCLLLICISVFAQKPDMLKLKKQFQVDRYITTYDFNNKEVQIKYTTELEKSLTTDKGVEECVNGRFTDSATDNFLNLPNFNRVIIVTDLTEGAPGNGLFTIAFTTGSLMACVSSPYNPRTITANSPMQVYYGHCFGIPIGKIRGCQTGYGWRVEGDMNKDSMYEAVLKILLQ